MKLLAVIVNYRTAPMTLESLGTLVRELREIAGARAVVVDNDSRDGSYETIATAIRENGWGDLVDVVRSERNGGFGYGCNVGIHRGLENDAPPDYFYLLNSDAFPEEGSLRVLVRYLDENPSVGIAGSYIHGPDGTPHGTAFRFPSWQSELEGTLGIGFVTRALRRWVVTMPIPTAATPVDWLAGASMLIRRQVIDRVGPFDETFFLYFEEVDLCRRAGLAGWPTHYVPASSVAHIGCASTGMKDLSKRMPPYYFASRSHYYRKNHGTGYLWMANFCWIAGFVVGHVRRKLMNRPDRVHRRRMFADFLRYTLGPAGSRSRAERRP